MTKYVIRGVVSVALIAMGLAGLYLHVEYSGWVPFFGLVAIP